MMDIIKEDSEERLAELLPLIAEDPGAWTCIHVNIAAVNSEIYNMEGLNKQVLDKLQRVNIQMAQKMYDLGLGQREGRIFIFEDSDIFALFLNDGGSPEELVEKIHQEFVAKQLDSIFHSYSMRDKLDGLMTLSKDKMRSAQDIKLKKLAAEACESIFQWTEPNIRLTQSIQRKRRNRTDGVILVIDDDLIARGLIASALKKQYKVIQAKDGKDGIGAYIQHAPNLVLLDIHLPDHNGHEVLNRIKLLDPEAYVVALSADSVADNVLSSFSEGSVGFIKKPFVLDTLFSYIDKCQSLGSEAKIKALGWSTFMFPTK